MNGSVDPFHLRCSAHGWVQIIKGITRNNFVKFIFASSSRDSLNVSVCRSACVSPIGKTETNLVSLPFPFRKLSSQTGERVAVWRGVATGHALYMPCTFHPLLPLGIRTGISSD